MGRMAVRSWPSCVIFAIWWAAPGLAVVETFGMMPISMGCTSKAMHTWDMTISSNASAIW